MNRCRSEKIALFLDCCFAGAFTSGMTRRTGTDTAGVKEQFNGSGLFVITASDAMQYSFEGGRQVGDLPEPSPFTKALVDGLRTGEADRNEDGVVSMNELFDYPRGPGPSDLAVADADEIGLQPGRRLGDRPEHARPERPVASRGAPGLLKSEDALDRFGALIDLRDVIEGPDRRVAEAGLQALQRLTEDDSRRVAAAAKRLYAEETSRPRPAPRGPRRHAAPVPADPPPAVIAVDPPPPEPVALESAALEGATEPAVTTPPRSTSWWRLPPRSLSPLLRPSDSSPHPGSVKPTRSSTSIPTGAPGLAPAPPEPAAAEPFLPPRRGSLARAEPGLPSRNAVMAEPSPASEAAAPAAATLAATWGRCEQRPREQDTGGAVARTAAERSALRAWRHGPASGHGDRVERRRSIARAAIGTPIWIVSEIRDDPDRIRRGRQALAGRSSRRSPWARDHGFWAVVLVPIAEWVVPAVRVPGGSAYRIVGGNRWVAAAAAGRGRRADRRSRSRVNALSTA